MSFACGLRLGREGRAPRSAARSGSPIRKGEGYVFDARQLMFRRQRQEGAALRAQLAFVIALKILAGIQQLSFNVVESALCPTAQDWVVDGLDLPHNC